MILFAFNFSRLYRHIHLIWTKLVSSFRELNLTEEVMGCLEELGISAPTEIQYLGIPSVLDGKSVVMGSHTGSGKTLAYMLPLVQLLRRDETLYVMLMKPRHSQVVVLCPTQELCEQLFAAADCAGALDVTDTNIKRDGTIIILTTTSSRRDQIRTLNGSITCISPLTKFHKRCSLWLLAQFIFVGFRIKSFLEHC